jgi:prepilin-type N-terminal cleavage/methylation domain-containing protein
MRNGFTLVEMVIACTVLGIIVAIAAPRVQSSLDTMAVEGATRDVLHALELARLAASRENGTDVAIDSSTVVVRSHNRVIHVREVARARGVRMRTTVSTVRFAATGLGMGLSNGTIYLTRGSAADTIVISRLGRVRR